MIRSERSEQLDDLVQFNGFIHHLNLATKMLSRTLAATVDT